MISKLNIDTRVRSLKKYLEEFEKGIFQTPTFQRDFLWEKEDIKELFDSIKNNYPIGSILFWKPIERHEEFSSNTSEIGCYSIKLDIKEPIFILDGYQRLSSLFGCLTNPKKTQLPFNEKKWKEKFNLYYDLEEEKFIYLRPKAVNQPYQVPVYIFLNSVDFRQYSRKVFAKMINEEDKIDLYLERGDALGQIFNEYQIASVDIINATIEEAVEIFRRINEKGLTISKDWIASALTNKEGFRLGTEIDNLLAELKPYNFDSIKRDIIFQCIQNSFGGIYFDYSIEDLVKRKNFAKITKMALKNTLRAVKFLYEHLLVLNNKLLPYNSQLVFLVPFFNYMDERELSENQIIALKKWFWITSYANYFTMYSLSSQRKAYEHFQNFILGKEESPIYLDKSSLIFETDSFPSKIFMGSVRSKSLALFMINYAKGITQISEEIINVNNIEDFEMESLFNLPKKENPAENFLPIITERKEQNGEIILQMLSTSKRPKDYSFLLRDNKINHEHFFITQEMKNAYQNGISQENILAMRKELIIEAEKRFVEGVLNLTYITE